MPVPHKAGRRLTITHLPLVVAFIALIFGGVFLLHRADTQARDTIRKHHLEDIEKSLYFAANLHGTYPPYDQPTWCGVLGDPANAEVTDQIEAALRQQNKKYANPDKPFPTDPLADKASSPSTLPKTTAGYFYWKRSPVVFELYSILETNQTNDRATTNCDSTESLLYDYGLNSRNRTNPAPTAL